MSDTQPSRYERRQAIGLFIGLVAFVLLLALPTPSGMEEKAWRMTATTALIAVWWVSEAVHPSVTALLPLALFPFLHILTPQEVSAAYADHVIFLFMGGFLIAMTMEKWHLHHRIALQILSRVGTSPQALSLGMMGTTAAISMWVSNVATTLIMLPIATAILSHADSQGYDTKKGFGTALMLMVAYGASIGGVGTPVGTPPNVIFLGAFTKLFPTAPPVAFLQWMLFGAPTVVILVLVTWAYLAFFIFPFPTAGWQSDRDFLQNRLQALGPMSAEEKKVLTLAATTAMLWIFREDLPLGGITVPGWSRLLPPPVTVQDSTVAMSMALLLFLIPADRRAGTFLLDWETAERLPWGVLILLGGGLALAAGVEKTGLAAWLGSRLTLVGSLSPLSGIFLVTLLTAWVTEFASNTATATLMMPVLAATAQAMHIDPLLLMVPATFAATVCNFMLPSATGPNAIVFTTGHVTVPQMVKAGIGLDLIGAAILTILVYFLGVPVFGVSLDGLPPGPDKMRIAKHPGNADCGMRIADYKDGKQGGMNMQRSWMTIRTATGSGLFLSVLLSFALATAAEDGKPAQRKRLAGIKPFTKEQREDFLSERRNATIATLNAKGDPQLTPVIFYWDGATFYFTITKETVKYKNIKRDPRVSVIVDDVLDHHSVIAKGKAKIQEQDIWDMTRKIVYKYYGQEEGDPYLEQFKKQNRVLIVLKPAKIQAWGPVPREAAKP